MVCKSIQNIVINDQNQGHYHKDPVQPLKYILYGTLNELYDELLFEVVVILSFN